MVTGISNIEAKQEAEEWTRRIFWCLSYLIAQIRGSTTAPQFDADEALKFLKHRDDNGAFKHAES